MRPPGMRTILIPPSNMAGVVSARPVAAGIAKKVSKYRALAQESGLPLIVAAGAHKFTGLQVQQLDDLLTGTSTLSVQLSFGDTFVHHPVEVDPFNPPRWTMPPELAPAGARARSRVGCSGLPAGTGPTGLRGRAPSRRRSGRWSSSCVPRPRWCHGCRTFAFLQATSAAWTRRACSRVPPNAPACRSGQVSLSSFATEPARPVSSHPQVEWRRNSPTHG